MQPNCDSPHGGSSFASHEAALHRLIRYPFNSGPWPAADPAMQALYGAALQAATTICHQIYLSPVREHAPEAVQEWCCQLQTVGRYDPNRPIAPFAYCILKYVIYRMGRKACRAAAASVTTELEDGGLGPFDQATLAELRELVHQMPENLRGVVLLRYFERLSGKQIATILAMTEAGVNMRVHAALTWLRRRYRL